MSTTYEMREGQGSLFINEKKTSDKQPDYNGNVLINGKKMLLPANRKKT